MLNDQVVWSGYEVETQTFRDIVSNLYGVQISAWPRLLDAVGYV